MTSEVMGLLTVLWPAVTFATVYVLVMITFTPADVTAWLVAITGLVAAIFLGLVNLLTARAASRRADDAAAQATLDKAEFAAAVQAAAVQSVTDKADLAKHVEEAARKIDEVKEGTRAIEGHVNSAATAAASKIDALLAESKRMSAEIAELKQTAALLAQATATQTPSVPVTGPEVKKKTT